MYWLIWLALILLVPVGVGLRVWWQPRHVRDVSAARCCI
jgi:hypothetical protein